MAEEVMREQPKQRPEGTESPIWAVALLGALTLLAVVGILMNRGGSEARFIQWRTLLGVIATLAIFSILYKENPVFRFMEHIFIGLATGVGIVIMWAQLIYPNWFVPMMPQSIVHHDGGGKWWMIFELLLGLLFYTVYFAKLAWMNRFMISILMGWAAGYAFRGILSLLGPQIVKSFKAPLTTYHDGTAAGMNNVHLWGHVWLHPLALVFLVVLFCTMAYFFFSVEHRAAWIRTPANAGRYFLMITLGAIFGTTVMGRLTLAIERLDFLINAFKQWGIALVHFLH